MFNCTTLMKVSNTFARVLRDGNEARGSPFLRSRVSWKATPRGSTAVVADSSHCVSGLWANVNGRLSARRNDNTIKHFMSHFCLLQSVSLDDRKTDAAVRSNCFAHWAQFAKSFVYACVIIMNSLLCGIKGWETRVWIFTCRWKYCGNADTRQEYFSHLKLLPLACLLFLLLF